MRVELTESERQYLRQLQKQRRDDEGYVKVMVILLLDKRRPLASIADDLGLDETTVQRYARTFTEVGVEKYLDPERPGYWGRLTSTQLARLCHELNTRFYFDTKAIQTWVLESCGVGYTRSGLTDLLHRLGFTYKLTTSLPCEAKAERQHTFLAELAVLETQGEAVLYFADAAHPTHNTRSTRVWCEVGQQRPLLTVSGRERVNLNAALNAYAPSQVVVEETACVNAQSTQRLYEKLLAAHPGQQRIYVVCDNARYYKNRVLQECHAP